jgi:raffinose/stachyose/melibiose transport system substrate-binding protein
MKKITKIVAAVTAAVMSLGMFGACGSSSGDSANGHVYYLSGKPEQQDQFKEIAEAFTKETDIPVDISVASSGTGEQVLKSELAKSEAPTLFDVDNNSFPHWTDYYADMSDTGMYKDLKKSEYVMKDGDKVAAVPYVMERYGIIYNKALLKKYFDAAWSSIKSIDKVNNFDALKTVADEIQKHKDDIGVKGAFSSAGFDSSSSGRFGDQLAHIPTFYEYRDQKATQLVPSVSDKYMNNFKNIFDLYVKDATVPGSQLSGMTMDDSNSEFALGESVFLQNGTWGYPQIKDQEVPDKDMGVLPIYIGVPGEEKAGLTVSFMYFAMNKNASAKDQEATRKFLDYILKNDKARKIVTEDMGFETPFKSYAASGFQTKNPIQRANDAYAKAGDYDITIYPLPTQQWVQTLSSSMLEYAQGTGDWNKVESAYVDGWASEYKTVNKD